MMSEKMNRGSERADVDERRKNIESVVKTELNNISKYSFDPKTAEIKEIPLPTKYTLPYDVATNKDASEVWTGSMLNDLVVRLNTKTGAFTEYLLPRPTNIRRVYVQDVGPGKTAFWAGSNHGASIVKVEPLD